jgi:hypothetical protein
MIVPVADYDFPPDLIDLQRAYDAADRRCEEAAAASPSATDIAAGAAEDLSARAALDEARAERLELAVKLQGHSFWAKVDSRVEAKQALRAAARQ